MSGSGSPASGSGSPYSAFSFEPGEHVRYGLAGLLILTLVLVPVSNLLICISICRKKELRQRPVYILLVNMAATDGIFLLLVLPGDIAGLILRAWPFSDAYCYLQLLVLLTLTLTTGLTIALMAVYRMIQVCFQRCFTAIKKWWCVAACVAFTWVLPLTVMILNLRDTYYSSLSFRCENGNRGFGSIRGLVFYVPVTCLVICSYTAIFIKVRLSRSRVQPTGNPIKRMSSYERQMTIVTLLIFVQYFLLTILPGFSYYLSYLADISTFLSIRLALSTLANIEPLFHTLLYAFGNKEIRRALKDTLKIGPSSQLDPGTIATVQ